MEFIRLLDQPSTASFVLTCRQAYNLGMRHLVADVSFENHEQSKLDRFCFAMLYSQTGETRTRYIRHLNIDTAVATQGLLDLLGQSINITSLTLRRSESLLNDARFDLGRAILGLQRLCAISVNTIGPKTGTIIRSNPVLRHLHITGQPLAGTAYVLDVLPSMLLTLSIQKGLTPPSMRASDMARVFTSSRTWPEMQQLQLLNIPIYNLAQMFPSLKRLLVYLKPAIYDVPKKGPSRMWSSLDYLGGNISAIIHTLPSCPIRTIELDLCHDEELPSLLNTEILLRVAPSNVTLAIGQFPTQNMLSLIKLLSTMPTIEYLRIWYDADDEAQRRSQSDVRQTVNCNQNYTLR
jgi:hypothetical protein